MKVENITINGWEDQETGLIIDENESWVLVKHIPADYVTDGYKLYNKDFIIDRTRGEDEVRIEKVLTLKNESLQKPQDFQFSDIISMLRWIEEKYILIEFQEEDQSDLLYGIINNVDDEEIIFDAINMDGYIEKDENIEIRIDEIRAVGIETDYQMSLCLLYRSNL